MKRQVAFLSYSIESPQKIFFVFFIVAVAIGLGLHRLKQVADVSQLVSQEDVSYQKKLMMEPIFGDSSFVLVAIEKGFNIEDAQKLKAVTDSLMENQIVKKVSSIFSVKHLEADGGGFQVVDLAPKAPVQLEDLEVLKKRLETYPIYDGQIWSKDSDSLTFFVEFKKGTTEEEMTYAVEGLLTKENVGPHWNVSGWPVINTAIKKFMDRDLMILVPLVFIITSVFLFFTFRSWQGVVFPLIGIGFAIVLSMGMMSWVGISLNVVSNAIPILLIAIATSYSIHFLTKYYLVQRDFPSHSREEHLRLTGKRIFGTIVVTAATTMGGFLANIFSPVKTIQEFGFITAVGVAGAAASALFLIPALIKVFGGGKGFQGDTSLSKWSPLLSQFSDKICQNPIKVIVVSLAIVFLFLWQIPYVTSNYSTLGYFRDHSEIVQATRKVSSAFGGILNFNIVIDSQKRDGAAKSYVLKAMDKVSENLKSLYPEDVKVTVSFGDYVKQMSQAYNGRSSLYKISDNDSEIAQYLEVYSWSGDVEEDFKYVADVDYQKVRLTGRFSLIENEDGTFSEKPIQYYQDIVEQITSGLQSELGDPFEVYNYGDIEMWRNTLQRIVKGQIYSILAAVSVVFLMTLTVLRSPFLSLYSLIPTLFAILTNFAFMAWMKIELDIATSLVSAMAIGIGVDDSVHFLLSFKGNLENSKGVLLALRETMITTGRAIVNTTAALVAGYSVFLLSSFKPLGYFGFLNILAIVSATLATVFILPSALMVTYSRRGRE
ncbi:MAG: MMPL family transporter [Bdellovibrionales bacterium]|nr:MMPL family transporter [Bdellovibrionales bacterium]